MYLPLRITVLVLANLSMLAFATAQCTFSLGADTVLCAGNAVNFTAIPAMDSYSWNTGASSPTISVNTSGQYICTASQLTGTTNLITNSNFNQLNSGFTSDYGFNLGGQYGAVSMAGTYFVTFNSGNAHVNFANCGDHTGGFFGMMLVANGSVSAGQNVWCQTVPVTPNTDYLLGFWMQTVFGTDPAQLQIFMNGMPIGNSASAPTNTCVWDDHNASWNSGNLTSVDFCIQNLNLAEPDNDFAIDDIFMYEQCVHTDTVNVTIQPYPTPNLGPDIQICPWDSLLLDASEPGARYLWSTGDTTASIYVNPPPTSYSVTVDVNGCTGTDQINVTQFNIPDLDLGPDTTLCDGDTLVLASNITGATYQWSSGSTSATVPVYSSGQVWLEATNFGCSQTDTINVTFNPNPTVNLGPDPSICEYDSLLLSALTPNGNYSWSNGSTSPNIYALPDSSYSLTVAVNGCTGSDSINVGSYPIPQFDLGLDTTICSGDSVLLDASYPAAAYSWNTSSTDPSIYATGTGIYWVNISDANNCTNSDSIEVFHYAHPGADIGPDQVICPGDTAIFTALIPASSYLWSDGSSGLSINATLQGWYWVDAIENGCSVRDSAYLTVLTPTVINLGPDTSICADAQIVLDATQPGATYLWSTGATTSSISGQADSLYSVSVSVNSCIGTDSILISSIPLPNVFLGSDTALCPGESVLLDAGIPGGSYLWQDASTAPTLSAQAVSQNIVIVTDGNGCSNSDTLNVSSAPVPNVSLGPDQFICPGDSVLFDASIPSGQYLWQNGNISSSIWASQPGDYSVMVTQGNCTASDTVSLGIHNAPSVNLGNDTVLCPGATLMLDVGVQTGTTTWQNGSNMNTFMVNTSGVYHATIIDGNGCLTSDTISVNYVNATSVNLGNDTTVCPGSNIILNAGLPGASYSWSNGTFLQTNSVSQAGTYWVQVSTNGCTFSDTIQVSEFVVNPVNLGPDTSICPGDSLLLNASATAGSTYAWSNGGSGPTQYSGPGFMSVTVQDNNSCISGDFINIGTIAVNSVLLGPDQSICAGDSVLIDGTTLGASSYNWSTGDTIPSIYANSNANYILSVGQNGCIVNDTVIVTVVPTPTIDLGPDSTLCVGDSVLLDATWPGAIYTWNTGANTPALMVGAGGTFSVTVDVNGCSDQDTINISYAAPFSVSLGNDTILCPGQTLVLNANQPNAINLWNGLAVGPSFTVNAPGTYWLASTVGTCTESDTITVSYVNTGALNLGPDLDLCAGDTAILDASSLAGANYIWQDGSVASTYAVTNTGQYWVQAGIGACTVSDTVNVNVFNYPNVNLGPDISLCAGDSALLDGSGITGNLTWSNGFIGSAQMVPAGNTIWLSADNNGCMANDTVNISAIPYPVLDLGPDTLLCAGDSIALLGGTGMDSYLWSTGATNDSLLVGTTGTYSLSVSLNGCNSSDTVTVNYLQAGAVDLGPDSIICPGSSLVLFTGLSGASYQWNTGALTDSLVVSAAGNYSVIATVSGCAETDTVFIAMEALPYPDLGADTTICQTDPITLSAVSNGADILWNTGDTTPNILVDSTGNYNVQFSQNGCTTSDDIFVTAQMLLDSIDVGEIFETCEGTPIFIDASTPGATYLWSNGSTAPISSFDNQTTGWVQISGFCIQAADSFVVNTEDCAPLIFVPNTFTPDGDGINDRFSWPWSGNLNSIEVYIFDRWGELIFSTTDPFSFWDGTYKGKAVQNGAYAYRIIYRGTNKDGVVQEELLGHVNVLR